MHRRALIYWTVGFGIAAIFGLPDSSDWRGAPELHSVMELVATLLALFVGVMALVSHYSHKNILILLVGVGYFSTAFLDGYHALVTAEFFHRFTPSDDASLFPWSWLVSRFYLALLMCLSWYAWYYQNSRNKAFFNERLIYLFAANFTLISILFLGVVPLPSAYFDGWIFSRPMEYLPAALFATALIGILRIGDWRHKSLDHWIILSLVTGLIGQVIFMPYSTARFDYEFDIAHLLKIVSYIFVAVGLLGNFSNIVKREAAASSRLGDANLSLTAENKERQRAEAELTQTQQRLVGAIEGINDGFALFDGDDRLVLCNDRYRGIFAPKKESIAPGTTFRELIMKVVGSRCLFGQPAG